MTTICQCAERIALRTLLAVAIAVSGCAGRTGKVNAPQMPASFVPDVQDAEWSNALSAKDWLAKEPRLIAGQPHPSTKGVLDHGETAIARVSLVIRADGTTGLYRIATSTNWRFTERVVALLRAQVYEPPIVGGRPVSVRGEMSFKVMRTD